MWKQKKKNLNTSDEVYNHALNLISYRDYGEKELSKKLELLGASSENVKIAVAKLKEYNFIDDKKYAQKVFNSWRNKKNYGAMHLKVELQKKQVAETYHSYIMSLLSEEEEFERALNAFKTTQKRKDGKYNCTTEKGVAALVRFLTARGFTSNIIRKTLEIAKQII